MRTAVNVAAVAVAVAVGAIVVVVVVVAGRVIFSSIGSTKYYPWKFLSKIFHNSS